MSVTPDEARPIASEAFVFGYPLVLMDVSRSVFLDAPGLGEEPARLNEFSHARAFPDASFTSVVSPNADTLYSTAMLDLAAEPVVVSVPASRGRYYLLPMLSAWTDVFASPGTRTTGEGEGAFAVVGPGWSGDLPADLQEIRSPTSMVWIIGRTQTNGKGDYESVHRFQDGLTLKPLSSWGGGSSPRPEARVDPSVDVTTPPPDQVRKMDGATFLDRLAKLLVENPPAEADAPAMDRFRAIGLAPGSFEPRPDLRAVLDEGVKAGLAQIVSIAESVPSPAGGWSVSRGLGSYGTDYTKRSVVALFGLGANLEADAVYPHATTDRDGEPLTGDRRYVLHFASGRTPPARAFWSLTMYDERHYFVDNPLDRYAIGDRDPLVVNDDGSLDLWLQNETPGPERVANWLPTPPGAFNVILRIYWPKPEVIGAGWTPPGIERLA